MARPTIIAAVAALALGGSSPAASPAARQPPDPSKRVCETVVGPEHGAKPYKLCMTKAEWEAKKVADAKDATRIVCHYEEMPGTRFRSAKVCMTAAEWWNQRQADRQAVERIQMQTCVPGAGC